MSAPIPVDDWMLGTIQTLNGENETARKQVQEWMQIQAQAQLKRNEFVKLCAKEKGVNLDEYQFDDKSRGFILKPEK